MFHAYLCTVIMVTLRLVEVRCARQEFLILQTKPDLLPTQVYLKLPMLIQAGSGPLSQINTNSVTRLHATNLLTEDLTRLYSKTPGFQNIENITYIIEQKRMVQMNGMTFERQRHINMNFTLVCTAGHYLSNITDVVRAVVTPGQAIAGGLVNVNETYQAMNDRFRDFPEKLSCVQNDVFTLRCPEKEFTCQNTSDTTRVKCIQMCSDILNPCQNNGKCHVTGSQMVCNCRDGTVYLYSGVHCEHAHMTLPFTIAINIGMDIVLVFIIVISIIIYKKRKQAKLNERQKQSDDKDDISMRTLQNGVQNGGYNDVNSELAGAHTSWRRAFDNDSVQLRRDDGNREPDATHIRVIKDKRKSETYIYQPRGSGVFNHHGNGSTTEAPDFHVPRANLESTSGVEKIHIHRPGSSNDVMYDDSLSMTRRSDSLVTTSMTSPFDKVEKFQISRPHIKTNSTPL